MSVRLLRALSGPVDIFDAPVHRKVEGSVAACPKPIQFLLKLRQANVATHRFNVRQSFKRRNALEWPKHFGNADIGGLRSKQALEDRGGWPNLDLANYFADNAGILANHLGDRITVWVRSTCPGR